MLKNASSSKSQGVNNGTSSCVELPSLSNSRRTTQTGQSGRFSFSSSFPRRVSRLDGISSLPRLHTQHLAPHDIKSLGQSKVLQQVTVADFQCFLKGYHEGNDFGHDKRGHTPLGSSRTHLSNELGHVIDEDEEKFRKFFGKSINDPGHSTRTLAHTRHRQLRQRRLRADDGLEPPWDALGQNSCLDSLQKKNKQEGIAQDSLACTMSVSDPKHVEAKLNWETGQVETGEEKAQASFGISYDFHQTPTELKETLADACRSLHVLLTVQPEASDNENRDPEMRHLFSFVNRSESILSFKADFFLDDFISFFKDGGKKTLHGERKSSKNRDATDVRLCIRKGLQSLSSQEPIRSRRLERYGPEDDYRRCCLEELLLMLSPEDHATKAGLIVICLLDQLCIPEPPLLPPNKVKELVENYEFLALAGNGICRFADLVQAGLVDAATMGELKERFDSNHDGIIQAEEFVEMLCPSGFRAHEHQNRVVDAGGHGMSHIIADCGGENFNGWMLDKDMDRVPTDHWQLVVAKFPEDQQREAEQN